MAKGRKKNASNQSGGTWEDEADTESGIDMSTAAAEMWSEDELRELIREEALKILMGPAQPGTQAPNPNQWHTPQWQIYPQNTTGNVNQYSDGHSYTMKMSSGSYNSLAGAC